MGNPSKRQSVHRRFHLSHPICWLSVLSSDKQTNINCCSFLEADSTGSAIKSTRSNIAISPVESHSLIHSFRCSDSHRYLASPVEGGGFPGWLVAKMTKQEQWTNNNYDDHANLVTWDYFPSEKKINDLILILSRSSRQSLLWSIDNLNSKNVL